MRKFIAIITIVFFLGYSYDYSYASVYSLSNPLVKSLIKFFPVATNTMLALSVAGAVGGYIYYKTNSVKYNFPTTDDLSNLTSASDRPSIIIYDGSAYQYNGSWSTDTDNCYDTSTVRQYKTFSGTITKNISCGTVGQYYYDFVGGYLYVSHIDYWTNSTGRYFQTWKYIKNDDISVQITDLDSNIPYFKVQDMPDEGSIVLPISVDTLKSISENVADIKQQLTDASYPTELIDLVTDESVADMISNLPVSVLDNMPLTQTERKLVDDMSTNSYEQTLPFPLNAEGDAVQVDIKDVPDVDVPTVPDVVVPLVPEFDTNIELPETVDFLAPVKNFIDNILNSVPFIAMFRDTNIEISDTQSVITFTYKDEIFEYDLNNHNSLFAFMSTVIIFVASVFAILILVV